MTRISLLPSRTLRSQLQGRASSASAATTAAAPGFALGDPGMPSLTPTLLIAVFDNSGSVMSTGGTDPMANRYAEVEYAFTRIATNGAAHELGAVLHFDTPTSGDVQPCPLTRRGVATLRQGLAPPPDGAGSSRLTASLRRAEQLAQAHPQHVTTLVVLSDMFLFDDASVFEELAAFPGTVHAVVLGDHTVPELAGKHSVLVTSVRRDDPPGAVAKAVFSSLMRDRRPANPPHLRLLSRIPQHHNR